MTNWFAVGCGLMQLAAGAQFLANGEPRLALMNALVAGANVVMGTMGGEQ